MPTKTTYYHRLTAILDSSSLFWGIVAVLVLQALWLALSGRYPMAFDEDYHLGIIRLYADHISPWWAAHPAGADSLGAVARDPSFIYHWLMSFPYRLIAVFTDSQTIQVLLLRFINIGLFASSLPLWRRVLLKTKASAAAVNACLAVFVLLPIVPLLAAQINYDNLLLPITALTILLTIRVQQEIRQQKPVNWQIHAALLSLCLVGCLTKFVFLAIALAEAMYLTTYVLRYHNLWAGLKGSFGHANLVLRLFWLVVIILLAGLFVERYGLNLVRYHAPVPDCDQVLSIEQCRQYGPWLRDFQLRADKPEHIPHHNLPSFINDWFYGMWLRTFFAVDGPGTNFQTRGPLVLPGVAALVFTALALASTLIVARRVFRKYDRHVLLLGLVVAVTYLGLLGLEQYLAYLRSGKAIAINGRYLLPVLLPLFLIAVLALNELLRQRPLVKVALFKLLIICLLWGGGALTYILRSNNTWYWPNRSVITVNRTVRDTLGPLTPGYYSPTQFMYRN